MSVCAGAVERGRAANRSAAGAARGRRLDGDEFRAVGEGDAEEEGVLEQDELDLARAEVELRSLGDGALGRECRILPRPDPHDLSAGLARGYRRGVRERPRDSTRRAAPRSD